MNFSAFRTSAIIVAVVAILSFGLGYYIRGDGDTFTATISKPAANITTITVPVPVVTEKVVKEFVPVPDQKFAAAVLAENKALKVKVDELSVSLAQATSKGTGIVTVVTEPATPTTPAVTRTTFKDYRLDLTSDGKNADYTLTQQFSIINTVGKNRDGVPTQVVRLFEIGPGDVRTPIPTVSTQTIVATKDLPRFYVKLTLQGGAGAVFDTAGNQETVAVVAAPWLKRGRSKATEDTRYAFLSPAIAFRDGSPTFGVLPVSFNIGSLPKQPFENIWISPFVGVVNPAKNPAILAGYGYKIGIVGTFTF